MDHVALDWPHPAGYLQSFLLGRHLPPTPYPVATNPYPFVNSTDTYDPYSAVIDSALIDTLISRRRNPAAAVAVGATGTEQRRLP